MSGEELHRKSRFGMWVFIILSVPVLYLLSVPPVILLTQRATPVTHNNGAPPPWLEAFCVPHNWVYLNTPLKMPMDAYANWWGRVMRVCQHARHLEDRLFSGAPGQEECQSGT